MNTTETDAVLQALSHSDRRKILDIVRNEPGCTVSRVVEQFETSRVAIMRHLNVLYDCKLLLHEKVGRSRHLYLNIVPIQLIYDRWTDEYGSFWSGKMADIKYTVEGEK
ncbi:MAG: ArsR/SmtB family transcription factor [Pseudohongiellaceae bacterium]